MSSVRDKVVIIHAGKETPFIAEEGQKIVVSPIGHNAIQVNSVKKLSRYGSELRTLATISGDAIIHHSTVEVE